MNELSFLQYLPILELLVFNLISVDKCLHRKYSAARTGSVLALFSVACFFLSILFLRPSFKGNGSLSLFGFIYLIPFRVLYKEKMPVMIVIICFCWVYTLGILSVAQQAGNLLFPGSYLFIFTVESLLFLCTAYPFYKKVIPRYIFVLDNIPAFDKTWYGYLAVSNCLYFLSLVVVNSVVLDGAGSLLRLSALVLLLATISISYFILYKVVLDSIRMNQLERAALRDSLTGIGNRMQLWNHLNTLLAKDLTFSVLFMDLDHFKMVNDRYGHMTGDLYLKHFAGIIASLFQHTGEVYRFGGDEFVAIYNGIVPQKLVEELKECRSWNDGAPCPFNQVSVGVLICRPPHQTVEQILRHVDQIMYQNKLKKQAADS